MHPLRPKGWPSLTVTDIRSQNQILDTTASSNGRVETPPQTP